MAGNSIHSAVAGALTMWVLLVYMPGPVPVAQLGKKRVDLTGHRASSSTGKRHCHVKMPSVSLVHDSDSASSAGERFHSLDSSNISRGKCKSVS
eukprot:4110124-Amphidinium_carterae.1